MGDVGDDADATFLGEFGSGFDFGEHGAGLEITVFFELGDFGWRDYGEGLLVWQAIVEIDVWNGGDRDKNVGLNFFGEFFGGVIFVYDGVYTFEALEDFGAGNWDAATAGSNNNDAVFNEF